MEKFNSIISLVFLLLISLNVLPQDGSLDPDFGTAGKSTAIFFPGQNYDEEIISMDHQADGQYLP